MVVFYKLRYNYNKSSHLLASITFNCLFVQMSAPVQKFIDRLWGATLFRVLPSFITPNYFTIFRIVLIPVILVLIVLHSFLWALVVFILASICDTIDGSLARVRNQFSNLGLILDPISDKLLVLLVSTFLLFYYHYVITLFLVIGVDVLNLFGGVLVSVFLPSKSFLPSDRWGKIKMSLQVLGIMFAILSLIFPIIPVLYSSIVLLVASAIFGVISLVSYGVKIFKT